MSRLADRRRGGAAEAGQMDLEQAAEILRDNQKLITLGRLTASIVHEINNPLESITNLLYLMEREQPEKAAEYLKLAQRELSRVAQISKQTLTFSRETRSPVRIQFAELIEEVLGLHTHKIGGKSLRIVRQYESHEPVVAFPGEMRQVITNLLSNAIEATAPGGRIVIRIRATQRWSGFGARGLRLSIGDNGSGIPDAVRTRLGQPFFTTKGQGGTGLGLWVTWSILSHYGGNLQLRSSIAAARHGTVFSLFLPLNLLPLAVISGGGEADKIPATGTGSAQWRGLRLIRQQNPSPSPRVSEQEDRGSPPDVDSSKQWPTYGS